MAAVCAGDPEAVRDLMGSYRDRVFHFLNRWLRDPEEARDVTQEVFFRVWQKAGQYDDRYPLTPWIYRIASNLCTDYYRRKNFRVHANRVDWEEDHATPAREHSPEEVALHRELRQRLEEVIDALPYRQRQVLRLRLLDQYQLREIAEAEGISVGTVKSTLHSGLCRVRESLKD